MFINLELQKVIVFKILGDQFMSSLDSLIIYYPFV
jgi:hypothetical protein